MTSTLYLYRNSKIIPSKNFVVDSLEDYLSTLEKVVISDYQYLRNDLNLFIKINKTQNWTDSIELNNYNYLKVVQNGVSYYYFILKKTQVSQSTIGLELKMDTLNTYKWGTAFGVSPRTQINREHKERIFRYVYRIKFTPSIEDYPYPARERYSGKLVFSNGVDTKEISATIYHLIRPIASIGYYAEKFSREDSDWILTNRLSTSWNIVGFQIEGNTYSFTSIPLSEIRLYIDLLRNIDYLSEGMDIPLYKKDIGLLTNKEDSTWNLVYHNDENEAINCHCIPTESFLKARVFTDNELTYDEFEDGAYYNIGSYSLNGAIINQSFKDNTGLIYYTEWNLAFGSITTKRVVWQIRRTGTTLSVRSAILTLLSGGTVLTDYGAWNVVSSITFDNEYLYYIKSATTPSYLEPWNYPENPPDTYFTTTEQSEPMDALQNVDRVDSQLIKIISIPYFPTNYDYNKETQEINVYDSAWTYSTLLYKGYRLNNLNTKFVNTIESSIDNPLTLLIVRSNISISNPSLSLLRNEIYESKLLHSDFYQPKFVYDSFGFTFGLERIDIVEWRFNHSEKFTFNFVMTSTINSKFLFSFPEYVLKYSSEDFDNILSIARNNEAPIYNSSYITYLRTAYRYDLKNLGIRTSERVMDYAFGTAKTSIDITKEYLGGNYGGMVSSGLSYVKSIISNVFGAQKDRIALQSKLESLKAQANSVSGSDDLDLLDYYSQNRAKLCLYRVSERMKNLVYDLFYYYGYTTNEIKIPDINSRKWFNFLSCDLVYTGLDYNISDACKEDLVRKYNEGATFLHMNELDSVKTWDFDQVRENWESSLFE